MSPRKNDVKIDLLQRLPLFQELNGRDLQELASRVSVQEYRKRQTIFLEGDSYRGFYVVLEGLVIVYKTSAEGKMFILHVCRPGDVFADVPLFEGGDYPAHAQATRDSTVLFVPKGQFIEFLYSHPDVSFKMLKGLARRLQQANRYLENLSLKEVSGRLARYILDELEHSGKNNPLEPVVPLPISKTALASLLGTTLETLSRTFKRLEQEKVLRVRGLKLFLTDMEKLKKLAQ